MLRTRAPLKVTEMKNIDFFSAEIETKSFIPCNHQAWSRASKNVSLLLFVSIASYAEKSEPEGAKKGPFCMGIWATLSLSTENAPRAGKNIIADNVASKYP